MLTPPQPFYLTDPDKPLRECVLPALRELLAVRPRAVDRPPETLARLLWEERRLSGRPAYHDDETALEALRVEKEVLA